jgi:hypothetical protein
MKTGKKDQISPLLPTEQHEIAQKAMANALFEKLIEDGVDGLHHEGTKRIKGITAPLVKFEKLSLGPLGTNTKSLRRFVKRKHLEDMMMLGDLKLRTKSMEELRIK